MDYDPRDLGHWVFGDGKAYSKLDIVVDDIAIFVYMKHVFKFPVGTLNSFKSRNENISFRSHNR